MHYIYDSPAVTQTQLMLAAQKDETEVVEPKTGKTVISKSATIQNDKNGSMSILEEMQNSMLISNHYLLKRDKAMTMVMETRRDPLKME